MKYSCPVHAFAFMLGMVSMIQHGWAWMEFQGQAMNKSFPGAPDLFGMEATIKRTNDRPEAAALCEVLKALKAHPAVVWCERMNSGAAKVGKRFIRFGFTGCPDVLGQLRDGRLLGVEVKAAKGRVSAEQAFMLERINGAGGVAFVARDCRDVIRELNRPTGQGEPT
jgi:hypothetical protein